ncbi:hypothetical protein FQN60_002671 [Etheostoma spectabile]|uniref:Uncharacterized protein n=1 Tax=Etheostoma spectabile TaxID=54343 RepID=A0A5J5CLC9_9PERO|nr:hypothetical protein FQN60_002671 [Etheostoma spectabile]
MALLRMRNAQGPNATEIEKKIKRGNALRQGSAWRGSRGLVALLLVVLCACGGAVWLFLTSLDGDVTETLVRQGCTPVKCGRAVTDSVASILDLHSGALSMAPLPFPLPHTPPLIHFSPHLPPVPRGRWLTPDPPGPFGRFESGSDDSTTLTLLASLQPSLGTSSCEAARRLLSAVFGWLGGTPVWVMVHRGVLNVRERIQAVIAETFGLDPTLMYLTKPTFFSRINSTTAKTQHDEYWHPHIDKVRSSEKQSQS